MTSPNVLSFVGRLMNKEQQLEILWASHPRFHTHVSTYNLRVPVTPAAVIIPISLREIASAIVIAKQHGLKVQARSGGHSYASYSSGGVDGAVVIDLRRFEVVRYGIATPIITIGSGLRIGNLAKRLYENVGTKYALPHGTCAGVGVGGHFTHGGFGLFSRAWGLAMDRIRSMCVVTANGTWVEANRYTNQDLFYAMQGAADSFGIATTLQVEAVPAPRSVVHWMIETIAATRSVESAVSAFCNIQMFVHDASVVDRNLYGEGKNAPVSYFVLFDLYGGPDSQINNKDLSYSAFAHRDALWVIQIYGYVGTDVDFPWQGLDFINGLANSITQHLPRYGAYSNYTDPSLPRDRAHKLYYGDELLAKLKDLKAKWDPDNVFANPQSI